MLISLIDPKEIEKLNHLKTVTSPILFNRNGVPDENGLLSNEIFGISPSERRITYAMIDLNHMMMTPHVYKILSQSFSIVAKIVNAQTKVSLDEHHKIIEDPNGSTGIDWLYENWDHINWGSSTSMRKDEKLKLLKNSTKSQIWIDRILVIPAGMREITSNVGKGISSSEINKIYIDILRLADSVAESSQLAFTMNKSVAALQNMLVTLYDHCKTKIEKKGGYIKQALFSKTTDYAVRSVISCATYNQQSLELQTVKYPYCELALSQVLVGFLPFVKKYIYDFFTRNFVEKDLIFPSASSAADLVLDNPRLQFRAEVIDKMIDNFIYYPETRFHPILVNIINKKTKEKFSKPVIFAGKAFGRVGNTSKEIAQRYFTYTDMMFQAACDASKNKHCVVTRYPILTYLNTIIQKVKVGSTIKTDRIELNGIEYDNYPHIEPDLEDHMVPSRFIETARFSNALLGPMGADFDGDQTTVKCLWSVEANAEAHKIIYNKNQFVGFDGESLKKIDNEAIQTLYMMTMNPKKIA